MKIFVVGDYYSGTGPANVTKAYIENLPKGTLYQCFKNKLLRLLELYIKIPMSDVVFLSGHSKQNLIAIKLAKKRGIKVAFLMHGCVEHENAINGVPDDDMNQVERATLEGSDLILAVSTQFEDWLKDNYSEYEDKISHLINGVDFDISAEALAKAVSNECFDKSYRIISIGGGMPRKRIVNICKAIERLNSEGSSYELVVAGDLGLDTEAINSYPFVNNLGIISHDEMLERLQSAKLFIQNSCFETFGLAPVEALLSGCDILLSSVCGALSIFDNVVETDIINDTEDIDEIASKIRYLMQDSNNNRLIESIDKESASWKARSGQLQTILKDLIERK